MIASTHRAHGHFLSKALVYNAPDGYQPLQDLITPKMQYAVNRTLAEIMGLREGWRCQARGKLTLAMLRHAAERARA